ncbi:MAG: hypothetical protein IJT60_01620 [Clostridia bacterium]|nr:hypothetical protein [Clostridia bacterium]
MAKYETKEDAKESVETYERMLKKKHLQNVLMREGALKACRNILDGDDELTQSIIDYIKAVIEAIQDGMDTEECYENWLNDAKAAYEAFCRAEQEG